jgi:lysophospholipase L1-like esterase
MRPVVALLAPMFVLFWSLAVGGGCDSKRRPPDIMLNSPQLTYLALGDSYTIGESVKPELRWPNQLVARLRARDLNVADPVIVAKTGWTTDELAAAIDARSELANQRFDLVTLLIGVNNQYRGRNVEEYRRQFTQLLKRAIDFAGGKPSHVIVLSIPDWGVTPFAEGRDRAQIAREIDAFNHVNQEETLLAGARYVDITPVSRDQPSLVAEDSLHPSGDMYRFWANLALPEAFDALTSAPPPRGK